MPSEREKKIIELFLLGHNKLFRTTYEISEWPDDLGRAGRSSAPRKAIDALAIDSGWKTLAIEHTIVEAFEGATRNDSKFGPLISLLKKARIPGYHLIVYMRLDSIDRVRASRRRRLGQEIARWFDTVKLALPQGKSRRRPTICGFRFSFHILKRPQDNFPGLVTIQRYPQPKFLPRLRRALRDKLPKLRHFDARYRILLLERRDVDTPNCWGLARALKGLEKSCGLFQVNQVWLADTSPVLLDYCAGRPHINFGCVWPTVGERGFSPPVTNSEVEAIKASR